MPKLKKAAVCLSLWLIGTLTICLPGSQAAAADASGSPQAAAEHGDLGELARHLNNPVSSVWNIVTQSNWYFEKGFPSSAYRTQFVFNFQPVLPIPLTSRWNLVFRPVIPLESVPYLQSVDSRYLGVNWSHTHVRSVAPRTLGLKWGRTYGRGDITLDPILVPALKPWLIFGFGPSVILPTASTTTLGAGKLQLGPAVVLGFLTKKWIGGVFVQNWWSVAGGHSTPVVNQMNLQYFLYRMLPHAWQVGFAPNILVDWRAEGRNQVTFPLGLGVGKTFKLGALPPVQTSLEFQWMVWHPDDFGQRFNLRFVFKPVVPALVKKPIFD